MTKRLARRGAHRRLVVSTLVISTVAVLTQRSLLSENALFFAGAAVRPSHPRAVRCQRRALDAEGAASFTLFSIVSGAPIPVLFSALFRRAEVVEAERSTTSAGEVSSSSPFPFSLPAFPFSPAPALAEAPAKDLPEPRDLMWAFPSFAVFLEEPGASAPSDFPLWARWLCLLAFWPGLVWYLWYKLLVEEDLRRNRNLGIGGYVVILPFALGLFLGVYGEVAFGALEGDAFANLYSSAFYAAFAWIYLNQWFLYNKVNQLFEEEGRPAPLDPYGLFVPGWNFVTGIRQIHFLAAYWSLQRGEEPRKDAFAELFPFVKKPTLTLPELALNPSLWIDLRKLTG